MTPDEAIQLLSTLSVQAVREFSFDESRDLGAVCEAVSVLREAIRKGEHNQGGEA